MEPTITPQEAGIKVGDILTGTWPHYGNHVYFYKVEGFKGKKTIILRHLRMMYDSKYASNSPGYHCAPDTDELTSEQIGNLLDFAGEHGFTWHRFQFGTLGEKECRAYKSERHGVYFRIPGDRYHPILFKWDGDPKWGCCD